MIQNNTLDYPKKFVFILYIIVSLLFMYTIYVLCCLAYWHVLYPIANFLQRLD
jgi:hypothetical protein